MFTIYGEKLTFALTNEQEKQFNISASTEDEKHWELHSIDENNAKLFTNGEYPLAALKTIVENILIRQINDPDIAINISQVKEDLLVIMTVKEKWVERKITLQLDSKKRATEIERLETLLAKTRRELVQFKEMHELQIQGLNQKMEDIIAVMNQPKILYSQCANVKQTTEEKKQPYDVEPTSKWFKQTTEDTYDVCSIVLPEGKWLVNYSFTPRNFAYSVHYSLMYDSLPVPNQPNSAGKQGLQGLRYNSTAIVHSTGEGRVYLRFSLNNEDVVDVLLSAQPINM